MKIPYDRLYEEVLTEWKKSDLADPVTRREVIVTAVLARTGVNWLWLRMLIESIYDKILPQPQSAISNQRSADGREPIADICPSCGLNDGHHYVSCPKVKD